MNKDNHLIMEAMHGRPQQIITSELHKVHTTLNQLSTLIDLNRSAETDQLLSKIRDVAEMLMQDAPTENAEGLSDAEYHQARKDAFEGAGEELGHGPIKVQLNKDTTIDCYKAGTVQGVRFSKGTIFNCDENVGDYYECDTEEYGGIAVFPDNVTVLNGEENAEHMDGITHTRNALGRHIMHMANYGIPSREEFIKIRHELHRFTQQIEDRGTAATEEEKRKGRHMVAQIRAYRSSNADDPGTYADDPDGTATKNAEDAEGRSNAQHAAIAISLQKAGKKPA